MAQTSVRCVEENVRFVCMMKTEYAPTSQDMNR